MSLSHAKSYPTKYAAEHSKPFLAGGRTVVSCSLAGCDFHLKKSAPTGGGGKAANASKPAARQPLPTVSKKRATENRERRAMANRLYPERPPCTVWELASNTAIGIPSAVATACRQWADDLHEPLSRARNGSITDEANACPLCRPCHDVVTFTPESALAWAYDAGLLKHSWEAA